MSRHEIFTHRWQLQLQKPFAAPGRNYVAPAFRADGSAVVLKIGVPQPDIERESEALRAFDGRGAVRLLEVDVDSGAMLLEWAQPGTPLSESRNAEQAVSTAARVMRQLWRQPPATGVFPSIDRWLAFLRAQQEPRFQKLIDTAAEMMSDLVTSSPAPVLLHRDLNPGNIVAAAREPWLAIDPKGEIGDPAFEPAPWFYNIAPWLLERASHQTIIHRRLDQFAEELSLPRERIQAWAFVGCVLSACWCIEDGETNWDWPVRCAHAVKAPDPLRMFH